MRAVVCCLVIACGGTVTAMDGGADAAADVKPYDAAAVDVADAALGTVSLSGTTVVSPSGTVLSQVEVCVYARPDLPCTTSDGSGAFTIGLPMDSETGVLLTRAGYASVLVPLTTAEQTLSPYEIGVPTAQSRTTLYAAFGATFPDAVNRASPRGVRGVRQDAVAVVRRQARRGRPRRPGRRQEPRGSKRASLREEAARVTKVR
jgi:hypothetical protein